MKKNNKHINESSSSTQTAFGGQVEPLVMPLAGTMGRIKFSRIWAMPNKWTFTIIPIKQLLTKYEVGENWIDPFAGENSPAEITNDIRLESNAKYHLDAKEFLTLIGKETYGGGLFDPPYSQNQVDFSYKGNGSNLYQRNTEATKHLFAIKRKFARLIKPGGISISFGWNSMGMGLKLGFAIEEIMLVPHGRMANDTIVTVERKMQAGLFDGREQEV